MLDDAQVLFERRICRTCGLPFTISSPELRWLESRGLQPFRRCESCRRERRQAEANPSHRSHAGGQMGSTRPATR